MRPHHHTHHRGESILEILLAVAIFAIVLPPILYTMGVLAEGESDRNIYFDALLSAQDARNIIQGIKAADWHKVATDGTFSLDDQSGSYTLIPLTGTPTPSAKGIMRSVQVESVRRTNGAITESGGVVDSATKRIRILTSWHSAQDPITTEFYITRSDQISSFEHTSVDDFTQGLVDMAGTQVVTQGETGDGSVTIGDGEPDPPIGLTAWWKMSGEYTTTHSEIDKATNGTNNLSIMGNVSFLQGRFSNAARFDSQGEYMGASSAAALEPIAQTSVAAWVKPDSPTHAGVIVHKLSSSNRGYRLEITQTGAVQAQIGNGTSVLTATDTTRTLTEEKWNHVVMTYDGDKLIVYIDGLPGDTQPQGTGALGTNTEPLFIAKDPRAPSSSFAGDIDDVQIYDTALTQSEIQRLLYSTYTSSPKDFGSGVLVHSFSAHMVNTSDSHVALQVSVQDPPDGNCETAYYDYMGPDGTEGSFYTTQTQGPAVLSGNIPSESSEPQFINPGRCVRYRIYLYSAQDAGTSDPMLDDIRFTYSR